MEKTNYNLAIDRDELKLQIKAVVESDMPERFKTGLHNLLGDILDNRRTNVEIEIEIESKKDDITQLKEGVIDLENQLLE